MKDELIREILSRLSGELSDDQLEDLKQTLIMSMEGLTIEKEETQLSTNLVDNRRYAVIFLEALIVAGKAKGTIYSYKMHINLLFEDVQKPINDITDGDLLLHLAKQKQERNLSNKYLNYKRLVFRSFFGWLYRHKYIKENPAILLDKIKYENTIKKPYTDEEREKIRCCCKRERDLALVDFMYSTAARVSEIVALNRDDINFRESECVVKGKGGKERRVYLNAVAAYHLSTYLESRKDNNPALFVECKIPYNRLTRSGIEGILRKLGKAAGVDKVHPHRYRRTALTNASNRGMPLQDVQCLAGHTNPNTTMLYCSVDQIKVKVEHKMHLSS